jgi:hypothetical protein
MQKSHKSHVAASYMPSRAAYHTHYNTDTPSSLLSVLDQTLIRRHQVRGCGYYALCFRVPTPGGIDLSFQFPAHQYRPRGKYKRNQTKEGEYRDEAKERS